MKFKVGISLTDGICHYPRGVVSKDGHPLEVGHFQIGRRVHFHRNNRGSSRLGAGHWYGKSAAPLVPLAAGKDTRQKCYLSVVCFK